MSTSAANALPAGAHPLSRPRSYSGNGPAPIRIVIGYGFWIFLLSDIIMFSALFATYAVLSGQTAGGPAGRDLFELHHVGVETLCLLFSSYTCGLGVLAVESRRVDVFYFCFAFTFVLGATFLGLELSEFAGLVARGAGPSRSAFLSAFFSLVGLHGAHVTVGLLWLTFMVAQTAVRGLKDFVRRRLLCFSLFWHALDIIWVALLSLVYLMGCSMMQDHAAAKSNDAAATDRAPGVEEGVSPGSILTCTVGLIFSLLLTGASFLVSQTHLLWSPGVPAGLAVLAIAQMGVHLVFFLHINTGSDNTNNVVALAFGVLIVTLIVSGTLWIMAHLGANMMPLSAIIEMHR